MHRMSDKDVDPCLVREELLRLLARQAQRLPLPVFAVLSLVAALIYPHSQHGEWLAYLFLVALG